MESRIVLAGSNLSLVDAFLVDGHGNQITAPVLGQMIAVRTVFQTEGLTVDAEYRIRVSVNGIDLDSEVMTWGAGLDHGQWFRTDTGWYAAPGETAVTVVLDPENRVAETSELDNIATFQFTPQLPTSLPQKLISPMGGEPQVDWSVTNYVDVDPRPEIGADWRGGPFQYDGHNGIDFSLPSFAWMDAGVPILAAADGVVTLAEDGHFDRHIEASENPPNRVVIDHGNGWESWYVHFAANTVTVQPGDPVGAGDLLGLTGSSGHSDGPHLHFTLSLDGLPLEPNIAVSEYFLEPPAYQGDLPTSVLDRGVTDSAPWSDVDERPSDRGIFSNSGSDFVWFWARLSHLHEGDVARVHWVGPDESLQTSFSFTAENFLRRPVLAWNIGSDLYSQHPGTWRIDFEINDQPLSSTHFNVVEGPAPPAIRVSYDDSIVLNQRTTPMDFGTVAQGAEAPVLTFEIENHGGSELTLWSFDLPQGFAFLENPPDSVASKQSATLSVRMLTDLVAERFGQIRFNTSAPGNPAFRFNIVGSVTGIPSSGTPTLDLSGPAAVVHGPGGAATVLATGALITDPDSSPLQGSTLRVHLASGSEEGDLLAVLHHGNGSSQVGVSGSAVRYGGTIVGEVGGGTGGEPLVVTFNSSATLEAVEAVTRAITFRTTSPEASTRSRYVGFVFTDSAGLASLKQVRTVVVFPDVLTIAEPIAHAGGPYSIQFGEGLELDASGSTHTAGDPLTFAWDLTGNGTFTDATGESVALTWDALNSFGITGAGTFSIGVRVSDPHGQADTASTTLTVTAVDPELADDLLLFDDVTGLWHRGRNTGTAFQQESVSRWGTTLTWDLHPGDFTGNGLLDVAGRQRETGQWWMLEARENGTFETRHWTTWAPDVQHREVNGQMVEVNHWQHVFVGDFTGDGRDDIVALDGTNRLVANEQSQFWLARSNGSSFDTLYAGAWKNDGNWQDFVVGDFNADGKAGIAGLRSDTGHWFLTHRHGDGFAGRFFQEFAGTWANPQTVGWQNLMAADFTGDGRDDVIARVGLGAGAGQWWIGASTEVNGNENRFVPYFGGSWSVNAGFDEILIGDFDGNDLPDLASRDSQGEWFVLLSNGAGQQMTNSHWGWWSPAQNWIPLVGDFTGNDRSDIAGYEVASGQIWVAVSNGEQFENRFFGQWNRLESVGFAAAGRTA